MSQTLCALCLDEASWQWAQPACIPANLKNYPKRQKGETYKAKQSHVYSEWVSDTSDISS